MTAGVTENLSLLSGAPNGIAMLRALIRDLAVTGRLVPQEASHVAWSWSTLGNETTGMESGWSPACLDTPAPTNAEWGVLRTTSVQPLRYLQDENKQLPTNLQPRPEAEVMAGDVLFTRAGPMNRVGISCLVDSTRPRLMLSDKIIRFRPLAERLDGRFTALCLNAGATARYLEKAKSGMAASQVNISQAKLKAAPLPVPPLAEQHRIVAKVDELMALCDRLEAEQADAEAAHAKLVEALLASLTQARDTADFRASWQRLAEHFHTLFTTEASIDALKQAVLDLGIIGKLLPQDAANAPASETLAEIASTQAVKISKVLDPLKPSDMPFDVPAGWLWVRLGSQVVSSGAGWSPSCEQRPRLGEEWGVLKVSAVTWSVYSPNENKALPANLEPRPELEVEAGDFLVSRANTAELVARSVVVESTPSRLMLSDKIVRLKMSPFCDVRFMNLVNSASHARRYYGLIAGGTSGSMKNVTREQILNLPVPLPPLAEQSRIVAKVGELFALCDQLKLTLAQARQHHEQLASVLVEQAVA